MLWLLGALACLLLQASIAPAIATEDHDPAYAGSQSCAGCHQDEHQRWQTSHHYQAMAIATPATVLGDFNDSAVTAHGITSRFAMRDGRYYVTTDGADGRMAEFEITHTFGVDPLQQYLVTFPDGRLQALGLAWDSRPESAGGQRWFHLYPDEKIDHLDELHWTGPQQNWNFMCADCHSTNLIKGYDAPSDTFNTTWSEITVGCESCHGPGQAHVDLAQAYGNDSAGSETRDDAWADGYGLDIHLNDRAGASWVFTDDSGIATRSAPRETDTEIQVCATCHSLRATLQPGASREASYLDHHAPTLLGAPNYHADGQIREEVYVWGSFLQSRMHQAGVTCSDCHDPHDGRPRAPGGSVCAQCHLTEQFAATSHHGHAPDSAGADCLACHMPETTYMVVDPRRDHSLRSPRPDQSLIYATPNACNGCHTDQSVEWAAEAFTNMFPDAGEPFQHWTAAFHQARSSDPEAQASLLRVIARDETPDIVRATALLELGNHFGPESLPVIREHLRDDSGLVRMAALRALEALPPEQRLPLGSPLLGDPLLAVRVEAARVLGGVPGATRDAATRDQLRQALQDYFDTQEYNADRPESRVNLGNLQQRVGSPAVAESYYLKAIELAPHYTPAYLNLADLYRQQGREDSALQALEDGLQRQPESAALRHSLGLALVRSGRMDEALDALADAVDLDPDSTRYAYVLGIALNAAGQPDRAIAALESAWMRWPRDRDLLFALSTIERDRGQTRVAREWADRLTDAYPADPRLPALYNSIDAVPGG